MEFQAVISEFSIFLSSFVTSTTASPQGPKITEPSGEGSLSSAVSAEVIIHVLYGEFGVKVRIRNVGRFKAR